MPRAVARAAVSATAFDGSRVTASPPPDNADAARRHDDLRTVTYLMLFRVALATLLLTGVVAVALTQDDSPENLGAPFSRFVFGLLVTTYVASLAYAVTLRFVRNHVRFAYLQIAVDLALATVLVHGTGGAQSGFSFLFILDVVAVTLLSQGRGAAYVAIASSILFVGVAIAGYLHLVPLVPGQRAMPWDLTRGELTFRLVLNLAALGAIGALATNLAAKTRHAAEQLTRHEQYAGDLATLHENTIRCLSSGLVTVSTEGRITSINDAAREILGVPEDECIGQPLSRRIPGLLPLLEDAGETGSLRRAEIDVARPDSTIRNLGVSAAPLSDHAGRVIGRVIHFQDLTELRRMQRAVERAERLASIGRLAAGVAHEIRNPLASISGSVEILKSVAGVDPDSRQLMDIAVREVDRLNRLITDLLAYARPPTEDREPLDLAEEASEVAKAFEQERRENGIGIIVSAAPGVAIDASAGQLRQVLWNLVRNAAEAMPSGGTIRVRVERQTRRGGGAEAVVSVSDTGVGIASAEMPRIFEPFFSTKRGGTGLGLATVARIVEDHRGSIDAESQPGRGTTFTLRFPAVDLRAKSQAS